MRTRLAVVAALAAVAVAAPSLPAQGGGTDGSPPSASTLDAVEAALDSGAVEEAREELDRWFRARWEAADHAEAARARFLRARVSNDASAARRDYLWVAVEGDNSYGDDAWLRLGQLDYFRGELESAVRFLDRLRRDYPESPLLPEAWLWTGRVAEALGDSSRACEAWRRADRSAAATATADRPLAERIRAAGTRCGAPATGFAVQLGAFRDGEGAEKLKERAARAGFEVVVTGPGEEGYLRVRTPSVESREAAERLAGRLKEKGLPAFVVTLSR